VGLAMPVVTTALGAGIGFVLQRTGALDAFFIADPWPLRVTLALAAVATALGARAFLAPRATLAESALGVLFGLPILALLIAWDLPTASPLFVVPALAAPLVAAAVAFVPSPPTRDAAVVGALLIASLLAVVVWLPAVLLLDRSIGFAFPGV